jgi:hypothetical protein
VLGYGKAQYGFMFVPTVEVENDDILVIVGTGVDVVNNKEPAATAGFDYEPELISLLPPKLRV